MSIILYGYVIGLNRSKGGNNKSIRTAKRNIIKSNLNMFREDTLSSMRTRRINNRLEYPFHKRHLWLRLTTKIFMIIWKRDKKRIKRKLYFLSDELGKDFGYRYRVNIRGK